MVVQRALALLLLSLRMMPAMQSSNSMDMIGKDVLLKFARIASLVLHQDSEAEAALVPEAALAEASELVVGLGLVVGSVEALAVGVMAVEDMPVLAVVLTLAVLLPHLLLLILSPTTQRQERIGVRPSTFET